MLFSIIVFSSALGLSEIVHSTKFSLVDEPTHVDYAWKISHGEIPSAGSELSPEILNAWSCMQAENVPLPACDSGAPSEDYPLAGENYNYFHPPLFYFVTGMGARALTALPLGIGFVVAARLMSLLWVIAGQVALYFSLRRWKIDWRFSLAASLLVILSPQVLASATKVNPDAAGVLAGVAAIFLLRRVVVDRNVGVVAPVVITLLVAGTKIMNALPILALSVLLLGLLLKGEYSSAFRLRLFGLSISMVLSVAGVYFGWSKFQAGRGVAGWVSPVKGINTREIQGGPFAEWLSTMFRGFNIVRSAYFDSTMSTWGVEFWVSILALITGAISVLGYFLFRSDDDLRFLALLLMVGCLIWPTIVQFQAYMNARSYFPALTPRYGIALTAILMAVSAVFAERKKWLVPLWTFVGFGFVMLFLAIRGIPVIM